MITKIKKSNKTTEIFFDEASDILVINTFNTSLKNRLKAYAKEYPELCRQTDDNECGGLSFEMKKGSPWLPSSSAMLRGAKSKGKSLRRGTQSKQKGTLITN